MSKVVPRIRIDRSAPRELRVARARAARLFTGAVPRRAILAGKWDDGQAVRQFLERT